LNRKIEKSTRKLRWDRILLVFFTIGVTITALSILLRSRDDTRATDRITPPNSESYKDYFETRQEWASCHDKIIECLKRGETFYELLAGYHISPQDIIRINESTKPVFDLSTIKEGQKISIWLNKKSQEIEKLSLVLSPREILHVIRDGKDFIPSLVSLSTIAVPVITSGEVSNSFYQSAADKGIPPDLIMDIADIFAWDIDFLVDIRPGDTFQVILEECYRKGQCIGHGKILGVRFVNQKRIFEAFYFSDHNSRISYYDRRGKSLRKTFLKSPLRYRRISSHFSRRRFHPILKIYRPHYGVDYAAPIGTPVEAVADGRITFIGWKGDYGRYIRIRHNHTYDTAYGHLSKFSKGLKKGTRVTQGNVIGFVGASGLATGPHLDFSVIKNGRHIDPLRMESPPALRVGKQDKERFNESVIQMEKLWQKDQNS